MVCSCKFGCAARVKLYLLTLHANTLLVPANCSISSGVFLVARALKTRPFEPNYLMCSLPYSSFISSLLIAYSKVCAVYLQFKYIHIIRVYAFFGWYIWSLNVLNLSLHWKNILFHDAISNFSAFKSKLALYYIRLSKQIMTILYIMKILKSVIHQIILRLNFTFWLLIL